METNFTINSSIRGNSQLDKTSMLRLSGFIPAIIYGGKEKETTSISIDHDTMLRQLQNKKIYSSIINLNIDGKGELVILKDIQRHAFKQELLHIDFQRIDPNEKITMQIPLTFNNADKAPGLKKEGSISIFYLKKIKVNCFPKHLPESIDIDMQEMQLNQTIHLSDLKLGDDIEIVDLKSGNNKPIVTICIPRAKAEVEEEKQTPANEVPITDKTNKNEPETNV